MIIELMKKSGTKLCMSSFEAEWQLVYMQKQKPINMIHSTDCNCVFLGATEVIVDIVCCRKECLLFDSRNTASECATEFRPYIDKPINFGCFLGCNYINWYSNIGPVQILDCVLQCRDPDF